MKFYSAALLVGSLLSGSILCEASELGNLPRLPHGEGWAAFESFLDAQDATWRDQLAGSCGGMWVDHSSDEEGRIQVYFTLPGTTQRRHVPRILLLSSYEESFVAGSEMAGLFFLAGGEAAGYAFAAGGAATLAYMGIDARGFGQSMALRVLDYLELPSATLEEWATLGREQQGCVGGVALAYGRLRTQFTAASAGPDADATDFLSRLE